MNLKESIEQYKDYLPFAISVVLFTIIILGSLFIYLEIDKNGKEDNYEVEVNLPVINWGKYEGLSKRYEDDITDIEK